MLSKIGRSNAIDAEISDDMRNINKTSELQAVLIKKEKDIDVCLLIDSPYRILRVSFLNISVRQHVK